MVGTDGVTELSGGLEYRQFMKEIKELRQQYKPNVQMPQEYAARRTALLMSKDNIWETDVQKQTFQWDEMAHFTKYYSALKTLCAPVDIVDENTDLSKYPIVVAPAYQMVDRLLVEKWKTYVENGGDLILSCRTGLKDRNGHFFEAPWADAITGLIGSKIPMYDVLNAKTQAKVNFDGNSYIWNNWGDILEPGPGTETWATYADQFYKGKASVVHRRLGKGTVTYIGTDSEDGKLEKDVLKKSFAAAGIAVNEQPEGIMVNWRDGFWVAVNYSSDTISVNVPESAHVIFGTHVLTPAGVVVWK
jgi:beta-galactosidase